MKTPTDGFLPRLTESLAAIFESTDLPLPDARLVVAVSGGPDSLALLHALRQLLPDDNLIVAHLDHQLRPESAADAAFVRETAERWGLTYVGDSVDVAALAAAEHLGIEEAARTARYRFLANVAYEADADAVVTGHNADDQVETVLMHILRGTGPAGLRGMQLAAPFPTDEDLWLLRPLLGLSRDEIMAYCHGEGLQPLTDATNADLTFFRNRLRHELLPLLRTYNPQVDERLLYLSAVVGADYALLDSITNAVLDDMTEVMGDGWIVIDRAMWQTSELALRRSTLRTALRLLVPEQRDIGFASIEAARAAAEAPRSGQEVHLPGGVTLHVTAENLLLFTDASFPTHLAPQVPDGVPIVLPVPGRVRLAAGSVLSAEVVRAVNPKAIAANDDRWTAYVAFDEADVLFVRGRMSGERMQPLGLDGHSRTLKKIMIDRKIPEPLRAGWPIVADSDHAIWIVGQDVDHRNRVSANSKYVVRLRLQ